MYWIIGLIVYLLLVVSGLACNHAAHRRKSIQPDCLSGGKNDHH